MNAPKILSQKKTDLTRRTTFAKCCCFWQLTMNIYQKLKWYEIERHAFLAPIILQNESCALHSVASKTVHKWRFNPRRGQKGLLEGAQTFIHPSTKKKDTLDPMFSNPLSWQCTYTSERWWPKPEWCRRCIIVYLWSNIAGGGWGCRRSIGWSCPSRRPRGPGWSAWSVCGTSSSEVPRLQSETRPLGYRVTLPLAPSVLAGPGKRKENN